MLKTCLALFVFSVVSTLSFAAGGDDALKKGNALVQSGKLEDAIELYRKASAANPKNAKLHLTLGLALANKGDALEAAHHLQASAEVEPTFQAWYSLGLVHANQGVLDKAIEAYRKAIELSPRAYKAWYQLGLAYQARGDFDAAIEAFGNALKFNPNFPDAYLGLGSAYYWSGDLGAARDQAARLKALKFTDQSGALESWINSKEKRKAESAGSAA